MWCKVVRGLEPQEHLFSLIEKLFLHKVFQIVSMYQANHIQADAFDECRKKKLVFRQYKFFGTQKYL